jgi:hypothetical protein
MTLSESRLYKGRDAGERRMGKDFERSGRSLIGIQFRHLSGWAEENNGSSQNNRCPGGISGGGSPEYYFFCVWK